MARNLDRNISKYGKFFVLPKDSLEFDYTGPCSLAEGAYTAQEASLVAFNILSEYQIYAISKATTIRDLIERCNDFDFYEFEIAKEMMVMYDDTFTPHIEFVVDDENEMLHDIIQCYVDEGVVKIDYGGNQFAVLTGAEYGAIIDDPRFSTAGIEIYDRKDLLANLDELFMTQGIPMQNLDKILGTNHDSNDDDCRFDEYYPPDEYYDDPDLYDASIA